MDTQYKKSKYQQIVEKLDQTRKNINEEMSWRKVKSKTDDILNEMRANNDTAEIKQIFTVLAIPLSLCILAYMWKSQLIFGAILLTSLILFLLYYRAKMKEIILENSKFKISDDLNNLTEIQQVKQKINYINSGIEIKKNRIQLIRYFYMFFFPIFMFTLSSLIWQKLSSTQSIWALCFAFLIGGIFWAYFFKPEIEDLEYTQEELNEENRKLLAVVD